MALVVAGLLNKQIASELGTTDMTIKVHRGRVMRKMRAPHWLTSCEWLKSRDHTPARSAFHQSRIDAQSQRR